MGSSEHGNASMGSIKCREILASLRNHQFFKESSASRRQVITNHIKLGNHSCQTESISNFFSFDPIQRMQTLLPVCSAPTPLPSSDPSRQFRTSETAVAQDDATVSAVDLRLAYAATSPTPQLSGSVHCDHRRMSNLKAYCCTTEKHVGFLNQ